MSEPKTQETGEYIRFKVIDQDDFKQLYRMRKTAAMKKMMASFAEEKKVALNSMRFYFDNRRIMPRDTVESLGIKTDDQIDVFTEQNGGS